MSVRGGIIRRHHRGGDLGVDMLGSKPSGQVLEGYFFCLVAVCYVMN